MCIVYLRHKLVGSMVIPTTVTTFTQLQDVRWLGATHVSTPHSTIYNTREESLGKAAPITYTPSTTTDPQIQQTDVSEPTDASKLTQVILLQLQQLNYNYDTNADNYTDYSNQYSSTNSTKHSSSFYSSFWWRRVWWIKWGRRIQRWRWILMDTELDKQQPKILKNITATILILGYLV